jgi:hypothetical protein
MRYVAAAAFWLAVWSAAGLYAGLHVGGHAWLAFPILGTLYGGAGGVLFALACRFSPVPRWVVPLRAPVLGAAVGCLSLVVVAPIVGVGTDVRFLALFPAAGLLTGILAVPILPERPAPDPAAGQ